MFENFLNYRFRGTTMSYSELLVALENIIIDKVATVPTARNKKIDTSAPMNIGMAAKEDGGVAGWQRWQRWEEEPQCRRAVARKEAQGKIMVAREKPGHDGRVEGQDTLQRGAEKEATTSCTPLMNMTVKATDNEKDLQAWCLLEESDVEQWQEVISRRGKRKVKKANQASLLSVENSHNSSPNEIIEGQMGESQSHRGIWSRGPCDA